MRAASLRVLLQSAFVATLSSSAWAQMPPPPPPLAPAPAPAAPAPVYQAPAPAPQYQAPAPAPQYQAPQPQPQPMQPQPTQPQPGQAQFGAAVPAPAAAPGAAAAATAAKASDHETWAVGRIGLGWYGTRNVPTDSTLVPQATPVIGVRFWLNPGIGLDLGLGFYNEGGSTKTDPGGVSVDAPSKYAFAVHGGLPIALLSVGHYSFQITPELDIGLGGGSQSVGVAPNATAIDNSGLIVQAGARAGAEIQFGFMGIPQLALDASVGAFFATATGKTTTTPPAPAPVGTITTSAMIIGTSQINSPWDIFRSNIGARYYF